MLRARPWFFGPNSLAASPVSFTLDLDAFTVRCAIPSKAMCRSPSRRPVARTAVSGTSLTQRSSLKVDGWGCFVEARSLLQMRHRWGRGIRHNGIRIGEPNSLPPVLFQRSLVSSQPFTVWR
ncbi:hypothetical protein EJ06DRAFT_162821 [Trichodelitschia bisporula]|uniref:Uncharacterized protein n=1 Tax=Trichodelitschia bisporula TaxID=703511 RepID=A0A6G1HMS5_9PEZI|nr:hypothetical protein EJ06DRAFT_162821 [Trichodelitschia bisporula]